MSMAVVEALVPEAPMGYEIIIKRDGDVKAAIAQVAGQWCLRVLPDCNALFCDSATEALEQYYLQVECRIDG